MRGTRRRLNPFVQGSLFDSLESAPASSQVGREPIEMDLMSMATRPDVVSEAIARVKANRGAPGIDGITVEELDALWIAHGERICQVLRAGNYVPRPVRRVTIPKPGGGERLLGVPTVQDRLVQQMMLTVLEPIFEPLFSDSSFGFRPGRSQHGAVLRAKEFSGCSGRRRVTGFGICSGVGPESKEPKPPSTPEAPGKHLEGKPSATASKTKG